jgi:hypothetical protein
VPKSDEQPDLLPDDLRRNDQPDLTPDSLPPRSEPGVTDTRPDGGVAEHPIHDEDQDDLEPDDYEEEVDEVADKRAEQRGRAGEDDESAGDELTVAELGPRSMPLSEDK